MSWLNTTDDSTHGSSEPKRGSGYRVDLYQHQFKFWMEYTHRTKPVTLEMAQALARGLTRQGQGCRIVELPSQNVVEEFKYKKERL
jgi:hypothetical protein